MPEEFIINQPPSEEPPKARVTRRRLKTAVSKPRIKKEKMTEVLSNLYNEDKTNADSNLYEISMKKTGAFHKLAVFLIVSVFIAGVTWAGFFFASGRKYSGGDNGVSLSINGPTELSLAATTTYLLSYENNSNATLNKVVLNAYFPEGFVFQNSSIEASNSGHNEWKIGSILPYEKGSVSVTGLNYGSLNEQKSWRVFLNYRPTNFNSDLQKASTLTTVITAAPVRLTISGPDQVSVGTDITYTFNVQKNSDWNEGMIVVPEVPSNFNITSSSPAFDKNKQWLILPSTSTDDRRPTSFSLTGNYTGDGGSPAPMKGAILMSRGTQHYRIGMAQLTSTLIKNDVAISLAINGSTKDFDSRPGDTLNMTIRVKNQSAKQISNVGVKLFLTAPADRKVSILNWAELVDKNENTIVGEQIDSDTRRGIISWNSTQLPALAKLKPGGEVLIDVQLPIKNAKKFDLGTIKSPVITASVEAKFKDAARNTESVGTRPIQLTLNSDLTFSSDDVVSNAGEPGEKHTINWVINNTFHALKNITITATAFGDTDFQLISKGAGEFTYDETQKKITWTIPEMPAETDVLSSSFSVVLNSTNPTQNLLLSKAHLTATDAITDRIIDLAAEEISLGR